MHTDIKTVVFFFNKAVLALFSLLQHLLDYNEEDSANIKGIAHSVYLGK